MPDGGVGEVAAALGVPVWLGGFAFLIWLWLKGVIILAKDHDAAMAAARASCDTELAAVKATADVQATNAKVRVEALTDRIDHLVVDRDAWREAHREEAMARQAAERAAAALMETGQVSLALLGALKDALAGRPEQGVDR